MTSTAPDVDDFLDQADAGLEVELEDEDPELPEELREEMDRDPSLRTAFEDLTPGRQRGWILHIPGAKKAETRRARVQRAAPKMHEGKGPNER